MWPFTLPYYISQKIFVVDHVSVYKSNELGSVSINHLHWIMCPFTVVNKALDSFFNITRSFIKHNISRRVFEFFIALLGKCGVVHYAISLCNHKSELSSL